MSTVLTTCPYCGCGCGFYLHTEHNKLVGVTPSQEHPVSRGTLCVKGWNAHEMVHHPERLKYPMIRENGVLRRASWEEALDFTARKLQEIRDKYTTESIGFFTSAKVTNEENYVMMKLARGVFLNSNIDHCARL